MKRTETSGTPTSSKRAKTETVGIVMDDEDGNPIGGEQSVPAPVAAKTTTTTTTTGPQQTGPIPVQKVDWRYLAKTGPDGKTNFARLVTVSNLNPKNNGCYVNFNKQQYERETGERFNNKATRNALTIEGPWMKVVFSLKDSDMFPGSFSAMLSTDNYDADEEVADFVEFMQNVFDETFKQEIRTRGYEWMKDDKEKQKHDIVTKHRDNTSNALYKRAWDDGDYTQEQYEAEVDDYIKCSLRPLSKDGAGPMMLYLKAYPVDKNARPCVPDVLIFNNEDPPQPVPYLESPLCKKKDDEGFMEMFIKPVFSIARLSFAQSKFHITPVVRIVRFQTVDELESDAAGGVQEMPFQFEGQSAPVMLNIQRKTSQTEDEEHQ